MSLIDEFKKFAMRGNVLDLAVGVIIGAAFGKIVSALVDNIIMPIIGALVGGINFDSLAITIGKAQIMYGSFISATINFLIIAFVLFLLLKAINRLEHLGRKQAAVAAAPVKTSEEMHHEKELALLADIRDLLQKMSRA